MTPPDNLSTLLESASGADRPRLACTYWDGGTWECRGDGYLWDADADGYDPADISYPCPACNTEEYLRGKLEHARGWSSYLFIYTSGAEHWRQSVENALAANRNDAERVLADIGPVACDDWETPDAPDPRRMVKVVEIPASLRAREAGEGR